MRIAAGALTALVTLVPSAFASDCTLEAQAAKNKVTYAQLAKAGDNADKPRPTSFYFYGDAKKIEALEITMKNNGFAIEELPDGQSVIAATNVAMKPEVVDTLTVKICVTAENHDVAYDGWETVVVKK